MSKSFMETVYGPLSKEYCIYFYILSIIGFVLLIIVVLSTLFIGIITKKKNNKFYMEMFMLCIPYALMYFTNRLLYSMCSGGLEGLVKERPKFNDNLHTCNGITYKCVGDAVCGGVFTCNGNAMSPLNPLGLSTTPTITPVSAPTITPVSAPIFTPPSVPIFTPPSVPIITPPSNSTLNLFPYNQSNDKKEKKDKKDKEDKEKKDKEKKEKEEKDKKEKDKKKKR